MDSHFYHHLYHHFFHQTFHNGEIFRVTNRHKTRYSKRQDDIYPYISSKKNWVCLDDEEVRRWYPCGQDYSTMHHDFPQSERWEDVCSVLLKNREPPQYIQE